jgi:hypothetical protein
VRVVVAWAHKAAKVKAQATITDQALVRPAAMACVCPVEWYGAKDTPG